MSQEKMLGEAIHIATVAHHGQYDKSGKPYILHPLHLMHQLMFDLELAQIAVLHDTIEDSRFITASYLQAKGFTTRVIEGVTLLTHKEEPYDVYIEGMCNNYDCIRVKRKDLGHNSDITRLKGITEKDLARMAKYHRAFTRLGEAKRAFVGRL